MRSQQGMLIALLVAVKRFVEDGRVTRHELPTVLPVAAGVALVFGVAGTARADIDPPRGLEWLHQREVEVANLAAFRDWVFVAWPCNSGLEFQGYCVIRPETGAFYQQGTLYALSARDAQLGPVPDVRRPVLRLGRLAVTDEQKFFQGDPRLVRPGFDLDPWGAATAKNIGARSVRFRVQIDSVGAEGVKAHFTSARYECRNGAMLEVPWGPDQQQAPLPRCPATDDWGQLIGPFDGGVAAPGATAGLAPAWERPSGLPVPRGHAIWLGVFVTSLSLLGAGLLLRRDAKTDRGEE